MNVVEEDDRNGKIGEGCIGTCIGCGAEVPVATIYTPPGGDTILVVCSKCKGSTPNPRRKAWKGKQWKRAKPHYVVKKYTGKGEEE